MRQLLICSLFFVLLSCKPEKRYKPFSDVAGIAANLQPAGQEAEIDPRIENIIKGENGTVVYLPANAFLLPDGSLPKGKISLSLTECYTMADFLSNRISTTADSSFLETGGMVYLSAKAEGKELSVAGDKSFVIGFPKTDKTKEMETFYGVKDAKGNISWKPALERKGDLPPMEPGLLADSSLYPYRVGVCGYTYSCNDYTVDWRIQHADSTLFGYMEKRLAVPDSISRQYRSQIAYTPMTIQVKGRKISDVQFGNRSTPAEYKDVLTKFLKEAPPLMINDQNSCSVKSGGLTITVCYLPAFDSALYQQRFNRKYGQYRSKAIAQIDPEELNYYMLSAAQLGWINCDRFIDFPGKKTDYLVKVPQVKNTRLQMAFVSMRSVMQGEPTEEGFLFRNVPVGSPVNIIAVAYQNGQPALGTAETTVTERPFQLEKFNVFSLAELEKALAAF